MGGFRLRRHSSSRSKTVAENLSTSVDAIKARERDAGSHSREGRGALSERASLSESQMKEKTPPRSFTTSLVHRLDDEPLRGRGFREEDSDLPASASPSLPNISHVRNPPEDQTHNIKTEFDADNHRERHVGARRSCDGEDEHLVASFHANEVASADVHGASAHVHQVSVHIPDASNESPGIDQELVDALSEVGISFLGGEKSTNEREKVDEDTSSSSASGDHVNYELPVPLSDAKQTGSTAYLDSGRDSPPTVSNSNTASSLSSSPSTSQSNTVIHDGSEHEASLPFFVVDPVSVNSNKSKNVIQTQINTLILLPDIEK